MGSKVRKMLGMVLVVSMIVSSLTGFGKEEAKATQPQQPVKYLFYDENNRNFEVESCTDYVRITEDTTEFNGSEGESWYVAEGTVTVSERITVTGTVNLILKDNCVFTAAKGINVASGNALTIYGQGTINGANTTAGELRATGGENEAGIGGGNREDVGSITINGGKVTATSKTTGMSSYGAGIGGGNHGAGGNITISGGEVTATACWDGAGIGGGYYGTGGSITITGGEVTAIGDRGAGIGGACWGTGVIITISGGKVITAGSSYGAGIGCGARGAEERILITGGKVTADGGQEGYGIGGSSNGGSITITGGEVTAIGGRGHHGIGLIEDITITGGRVTAIGGKSTTNAGSGIGGSKKGASITITGGMIESLGGQNDKHHDYAPGIEYVNNVSSPAGFGLPAGIQFFTSTNEDFGFIDLSESGTFDQIKRYVIVYKNHSGLLTASGSAINAIYIDGDGNKQSTDLAIKAPTEIVFGKENSEKAVLEGVENFNVALGKTGDEEVSESQIEYYDENGQLRGDAPTAKGNYTAKITVDGVTAAVDYAVKEDPVITAPEPKNDLKYSGSPLTLISAGSTTGGTLKYSQSENGTFSADIPTATAAGTYTIFYMVEGNNDYKSSIKYSVSAGISKASLNLSLTQDGWEKGNTAPNPVLSGNKGGGSVTYAYKKQSDNDNAYVDNAVPTEPGEYVVRATVSETQNYFGGTATAEFTITDPEPDPAPVTVYQPSYYPVEPKPVEKKGDGRTTTTQVKNSDGTISEISVTKLTDGSITRETVRDKDGKFVEYKYEYTRTKKNGTTVVQTFNEKADGSKKETSVTTTKSGTVSTRVKELTADGTLISTEGKSYADGRTSLKEATTGTDGVTKVVTEKTDAAGNGVKAEYTSVIDDAEAKSDTKISLTAVEVIGTTFKLPAEIWVNEQYFVVTEIGKGALKNNKAVTKLTIGENVTGIGSSAFRNMTNLKSITINASSLESVGKNAFKGVGDKKRETITIKGVTEEEFEKICKMIRKAGIGKKAVFIYESGRKMPFF